MQSQGDLEGRFRENLDAIAIGLIDAFGLKYKRDVSELSEPLLRWLDFVYRYIGPWPRQVVITREIKRHLLGKLRKPLRRMIGRIEVGEDINPYQSKGLIEFNDTSAAKRQMRTDLLWADWGIHHLHLPEKESRIKSSFSERSKWLLFCVIENETVGLIDVRRHDEINVFSDTELLKVMARDWPQYMERFRLRGALPGQDTWTSNQIGELRRAGIATFITIDGKAYMGPGSGVTSASTSTCVTMRVMDVRRSLKELAKMVYDPVSQFKTEVARRGAAVPFFSLCLTQRGMAVYEETTGTALVLPRAEASHVGRNFLTELHDIVVPGWAMERILGEPG